MRLGVIADTHIPRRAKAIPDVILAAFAGVDLILHAGDVVVADVLDVLRQLAPVEVVQGNNDHFELPLTRELHMGGFRIGLAHGHVGTGNTTVQRALSHFTGAHCVVFGHSHIPYCEWHGTTLAFNPGSATDRRRAPRCSYGLLHLDGDGVRAELRYIDPT